MRRYPRPYQFRRHPRALRKSKLDNLALVPASLLPFKEQWQEVANSKQQGSGGGPNCPADLGAAITPSRRTGGYPAAREGPCGDHACC